VELNGNFAEAQVLVQQVPPDGSASKRSADLTRVAMYTSADEATVRVSPTGQLLAIGNGTTTITATVDGVSNSAEVMVSGVEAKPAMTFDTYIRPTISRLGCNAGSCHASQTLDMLFQHLSSKYAITLPEGVTIDGKNSQTLLTGKNSKGAITLTAAATAPKVRQQQCCIMANVSINFVMKATYSSKPILISIIDK